MKLHKSLIPLSFVLLTVGCCRRAANPEFVDLTLDTVVRCGVVPCDVSYRFASIANADRSEALAAIENANVNYFFALGDFTGTADEAAGIFLERWIAETACDTLYLPDMRYTLRVESGQRAVDSLIVYSIRRESYAGGAHGMRSAEYHNYWTQGGYELSLGDLVAEERLPALAESIKAKLREAYDAADDEALARLGFFPETIAPTENFEVTADGVIFHYNPYEIACYAVGDVEVAFSHAELP